MLDTILAWVAFVVLLVVMWDRTMREDDDD
jgi:hypothetical protein